MNQAIKNLINQPRVIVLNNNEVDPLIHQYVCTVPGGKTAVRRKLTVKVKRAK